MIQGYYFTIIVFWWGQCMFVLTQWKYIFILFQSCELCIHDIPLIFWEKYGIPLHLLISNKCGCLSVIQFNKTLHVLTFWKCRRVRDVAIYWLIVYCLTSSITAILRTSASSTIYRTTIYIYIYIYKWEPTATSAFDRHCKSMGSSVILGSIQ